MRKKAENGGQEHKGRKTKTVQEMEAEVKTKLNSLKSFLESGSFDKLGDIEHLFSKVMADQLGVNHGRFIYKFKHPILFSVKDLFRFAYYVHIRPELIFNQVQKEIAGDQALNIKLNKFKAIVKKRPKR